MALRIPFENHVRAYRCILPANLSLSSHAAVGFGSPAVCFRVYRQIHYDDTLHLLRYSPILYVRAACGATAHLPIPLRKVMGEGISGILLYG